MQPYALSRRLGQERLLEGLDSQKRLCEMLKPAKMLGGGAAAHSDSRANASLARRTANQKFPDSYISWACISWACISRACTRACTSRACTSWTCTSWAFISFTSLPCAQDTGGETPCIDTQDGLKASDCGRLGRQAAGHPWNTLRVVKSCRKDCPTASVLPKPSSSSASKVVPELTI
jgi:hypothetical protein